MSHRACVAWLGAGLLLCPGCFDLLAQPKTPPKVGGQVALVKAKKRVAEARARSGWELQSPDLALPDLRRKGEAQRTPAKVRLTATGWQVQRPNLAPDAPASPGEGRLAGWGVSWPDLPSRAESPQAEPEEGK